MGLRYAYYFETRFGDFRRPNPDSKLLYLSIVSNLYFILYLSGLKVQRFSYHERSIHQQPLFNLGHRAQSTAYTWSNRCSSLARSWCQRAWAHARAPWQCWWVLVSNILEHFRLTVRSDTGKFSERDLPDYSARGFEERGFTIGIGGWVLHR